MKIKLFVLVSLLFTVTKIIAQPGDEEAIKNTARMETEAFLKRDSVALKDLFVHDDKTSWVYAGEGFYNYFTGWEKTWSKFAASWKKNPPPPPHSALNTSDYLIRIKGDMATVEYNQEIVYTVENDTPFHSRTHESRTMIKDNAQWKISSITSVDTSLGSTAAQANEDKINGLGYAYLGNKKIKEAIEIFKLNVKLFPGSWNVYDSLGEAYAADGDTEDAIKNYEMSIKINPKNDSGKQTLEKLKKK